MFTRGNVKSSYGGRGTKNAVSKVPLKGLFSDGIWKCNCDPRLPAQHFQTKNGGKNHGRWFYTCQLPQPKRCDFFLWDDEAKGREAAVLLKNLQTERNSPPITPSKPPPHGLPTPQTGRQSIGYEAEHFQTPDTPSKPPRRMYVPSLKPNDKTNDTHGTATTVDSNGEEYYDWPASDEDEMGKFADQASSKESSMQTNAVPPLETPRKAARTATVTSPGKRRSDDLNDGHALATPTTGGHGLDRDVFTTLTTSLKGGLFNTLHNPLPAKTPSPLRYNDIPPNQESELAKEILTSLETALSAPLFAGAREDIKAICNRHVLHTKGVMKGRDVSRATLKRKEEQIAELQSEIEGLKLGHETDRAVIKHLRRSLRGGKEEA